MRFVTPALALIEEKARLRLRQLWSQQKIPLGFVHPDSQPHRPIPAVVFLVFWKKCSETSRASWTIFGQLKRGLGIAELQALGDVNGDGRLTAVELGKVFAAVGINADEELVYEVWRHIDTNHNGQVSLFELFQAMKPSTTEVLTALSHVKYRRHASLSTLFRPYDSNGDDKLTPAEFHRMLNDLGFELDDEGVRDLLQVIVRDRDGGNLLSLRDLTLALESLERQAGRPDLRMGGSSKASAVESTLPRSPDRLVMDSPKRSPERPMTAPPPGTEAVPSQESQAQKASKLAELQNPVVPFKHAIKRLDPCGLPLGAQAWESLNRIFYRLAQQSKEVSTKELILAIRSDVRIKTEGLLHRPVIATDDGGPAVSLDEALHQVETQVLDGIGHLEMVSWDRWLAQDCCCNEEMLYRLYEKFTYCCGGDLVHVPRERFLQAVQNSENLYAALTTTPLLSGRPVVVKPMNWGDVLWQLSRREASLLSWSDIVATVCWCRAWSLGLSESETLHVSPRVRPSSASAAKARVEALLQNRAADATDNRAKPSPLQPSFAVPQITRMQDMQSRSPLETVSRRLAEASGSGFETRTQRSKHPWLDDSDDDVPSRVSVSRVPAPEVPRLSNEASHSRHSHGKSQGQAPVALRLQMPEGRPPPDPKELQRCVQGGT
ncbi:Calm4 [Symbiodinium sp. CCMP2592]|nr:Calm4 [Symbiodinium sp. CCMP2592]